MYVGEKRPYNSMLEGSRVLYISQKLNMEYMTQYFYFLASTSDEMRYEKTSIHSYF